jgi:DNA processing protein
MTGQGGHVDTESRRLALMRLTLTPGLGSVLIARACQTLGGPEHVCRASAADLERVAGIGPGRSAQIARGLVDSQAAADRELNRARSLGVRVVIEGEEHYPPLLAALPTPPPVLYLLGTPDWGHADRYPVAIVGSRDCTQYGLEQSRRFAGSLAGAGLTVVSGGARGIDSAAHIGALNAGGRTVAVMGCGLAHAYPPENKPLFQRIVSEGRGAIVSELPLDTPPSPENFPARNRVISGISLGVLVVEAGLRSGALITARIAVEDHGREVLAVPGRVDSPASRGTLELLRSGGAGMALEPADVINALEAAAHHVYRGTHAVRFPGRSVDGLFENGLAEPPPSSFADRKTRPPGGVSVPDTQGQSRLLAHLEGEMTIEQVAAASGLSVSEARSAMTLLEIQGRVRREGTRLRKA